MAIRKFFIVLLLLMTSLIAAGCAGENSSSFPDESEYSEDLLALGSVNRYAGVVVGSGETTIEKDESRTISSIQVSAGDTVSAGQVLFTYDGAKDQLAYDQAAIELEQMRLTLDSYGTQRSELESEKAAAPESEQLSYTIQIQELDTTIREESYNITLKEKEVANLQNSIGELEVKAPVSGKVQSINPEGGTDANGNPLPFMILVRTSTYRIKAYANEETISELQPGMKILVRSRTDTNTWTGKIESIDYKKPSPAQGGDYDEADPDTSVSSKYPVYVELDSSDGLMLGQHVFIEPIAEEPAVDTQEEVAAPETAASEVAP
ncbi:MAG: HlyD family efflux transporter periplasmic adaptor subunit [Parasporobacterium sp.]|nr:HlyD family efflux transporter periplasmic adaptor subunit [Parasporobacterium sp.]